MDLSHLIPASEIRGEDQRETTELLAMLDEAKEYVSSFRWCPPILSAHMGFGVGGVLAVFLMSFARPIGPEGDRELWVVIGDLPSAYLVTDAAPTPQSALAAYCQVMQDWVDAVQGGQSLDEVFPVKSPADSKHAAALQRRIDFIRGRIIPELGPVGAESDDPD